MGRLVGLALELEALPSLVEGFVVVFVAVEVDVPPDEVAVEVVLVAVDVELVAVEVDVLSLGVASVSDGEAVSVDEPDEDDDPLDDDEPLEDEEPDEDDDPLDDDEPLEDDDPDDEDEPLEDDDPDDDEDPLDDDPLEDEDPDDEDEPLEDDDPDEDDEPPEDDDPLDDEPLGLSMAVASVPVAVDCVSLGEWVIGPDGGFPLASATARIGAATRPAPSTVMKAATVTAVRFDGVAGRLLGCACFIEVLTSLTARRGRTAPGGDGAPRS